MIKCPRSAMWRNFDRESDETNPAYTICGETVKTGGNTSNLLKHLRCNQKEEIKVVNDEQETKCLREEQAPYKQPKQATLQASFQRSQGYGRESLRCKRINEALVRMLATDLQPATIVVDRGS